MHRRLPLAAVAAALCAVASLALAQGFKFDQADDEDKAAEQARQDRITVQLSTPCRADLKNKKIMVVIAEERTNGWVYWHQANHGQVYEAINRRLRSLGLRTYTPEEIRRQIAQAEVEAMMRNDPDAALTASKRLGASFVLRGHVTSRAAGNLMMRVNEVTVAMDFTLNGSDGRPVSNAGARSASYAGSDVQRMALTLVNEQADEVVAQLYADYCRNAGMGAPAKAAPKKP